MEDNTTEQYSRRDILHDIEVAERRVKKPEPEPEPAESKWPLIITAAEALVIAVCIFVCVWRLPKFLKAVEQPKPVRNGFYETDEKADSAIKDLWTISSALSQNMKMPEGLVCPVSGKPYAVTEEKGDYKVYCPDPQPSGLSELSVSKNYPVPLAVKSEE